jgi:hypothetical protein
VRQIDLVRARSEANNAVDIGRGVEQGVELELIRATEPIQSIAAITDSPKLNRC